MEISVRYLHNDMIKLYDNGELESIADSVTNKSLIRDTSLRSFISPQDRKMTLRLHHICGCRLCIILRDTKIDFKIFRTKIVKDLQHKSVGRHTRNITYSTKSAAQYKEKLFPDGGCLYATIKDTAY